MLIVIREMQTKTTISLVAKQDSHQREWPSSKSSQINARESVEKNEPSYTVGQLLFVNF